jgi:hypothetical protein
VSVYARSAGKRASKSDKTRLAASGDNNVADRETYVCMCAEGTNGQPGRGGWKHGTKIVAENDQSRTTSMEHRGPNPRVDADVCPCDVERTHRVRGVHAAAEPVESEDVYEQVRERERDRSRLLHTRVSPERPFAVELLRADTALRCEIRQRVHADIFAVVCARPERETKRERQSAQWASIGSAGLPGALLETSLKFIGTITGRGKSAGREYEKAQRKRIKAHDE